MTKLAVPSETVAVVITQTGIGKEENPPVIQETPVATLRAPPIPGTQNGLNPSEATGASK
jgi:hypothetical protein